MALSELKFRTDQRDLPRDVRTFVREADRRIEQFRSQRHFPAFVPCDFDDAFLSLRDLSNAELAPGGNFCEWGSGFGVVSCLASMVHFDACGIEVDEGLVDAARLLAADFDVPVEFHLGSYLPFGCETLVDAACVASGDRFAWLETDAAGPAAEFAPEDFDVIFAYPWPDEESLVASIFDGYAATGAVLVTYHGEDGFRLRRKRAKSTSKKRRT